MQVIIVLETKNNDGSDSYYLKSILSRFFSERGTGISIKYEYMNGKGNFERVNNKIKNRVKAYDGESHVIYCIDIDSPEIKTDQEVLNKKIKLFCEKNNYEMVYFNKTIEHVLLGEVITNDKTNKAKEYFLKDKINFVEVDRLEVPCLDLSNVKTSNILIVLNKYLIKKE